MQKNFETIQRILKPWKLAVDRDKAIFESYYKCRKGLYETYVIFRGNNHVPGNYYISLTDFKEWLKTLGYGRREENVNQHGDR